MLRNTASLKSGIAAFLAAVMAFGAIAPAVGQDRGRREEDRRHGGGLGPEWRGDRQWQGPPRAIEIQRRPHNYRPIMLPRSRSYNHIEIFRPYGRPYPGYGNYYRDDDALRFLGLTALSLVVFNQLNEAQQRAHEEALKEATTAQIGEPIIWNEAGRSGSVTAVRNGTTSDGRQCREFQQQVTIGGSKTEAYGTACQQPDGSWKVVND